MDQLDKIITFEQGELSFNETVNLFQELIDNGICWKLLGSYGRQVVAFIDAGFCTEPNGRMTDHDKERI